MNLDKVIKAIDVVIKRLIFILAAIVVIFFVVNNYEGCDIGRIYKIKSVKTRVNAVLEGIQLKKDGTGTVGNEQLAICRWWADVFLITDMSELTRATDAFDSWRSEANIFPYIDDFTIDEINPEEAWADEWEIAWRKAWEGEESDRKEKSTPSVYIVSGTVNGSPFVMRVPDGDTITWIWAPW